MLFGTLSQIASQNINFKDYIKQLKVYDLSRIDTIKINSSDVLKKKYLVFQANHIKNSVSSIILQYDSLYTRQEKILFDIVNGDTNLLSHQSNDSIAFNIYNQALEESIKLKDTILITESIKKIIRTLYKNRKSVKLLTTYLNRYKNYLYDRNEKAVYQFYQAVNQTSISRKENIKSLKQGLAIAELTENDYLKGKYHQMIGLHYQFFKRALDSSIYHYTEAEKFLVKKPYLYFKNELFGININMAIVHQLRGNYKISNEYLLKSEKIKIPNYRYLEKIKLYNLLAQNHKYIDNYKKAYYYLELSKKYTDSLNEHKKAIAFNHINTKYQSEKKEKENLQLKQNNLINEQKLKQNRNLLYGFLTLLFFTTIIAYLSLKNSNKKRLLAEQQKSLAQQKNLTLLKEQEITAINAMVEGQEKERVRIAEDLHDNIGSVLATLKLHFENLKINRDKKHFNQDALYEKTETLIDEAYLKIRSIAHAKNSGVIANKGLLVAIKLMAEKVSDANKITINVLDFGLDKPLENSLELTLFRIIQELVTNIIKHANASEATINISQFESHLNLIIEDNGIGFNSDLINFNEGMGLGSIQKRIEHLSGTFEIDSTKGKGTSIIIDIPLQNT